MSSARTLHGIRVCRTDREITDALNAKLGTNYSKKSIAAWRWEAERKLQKALLADKWIRDFLGLEDAR